MQDHIELSLLLDYYGEFLTERQRALMQLSVQEDLSLAEIAELEGISRQGVRDAIKRGEEQLRLMETRLRLIHRTTAMRKGLKDIASGVERADMAAADRAELIKNIDALMARIED